jgi:hypothetical protein
MLTRPFGGPIGFVELPDFELDFLFLVVIYEHNKHLTRKLS